MCKEALAMQKIDSSGTDAGNIWQSAAWYRALTLPERFSSLHVHAQSATPPLDHEKTNPRFQRWKSQPPFNEGDYFARRLAQDGLTEEDLHSLLAESPEEIQARMPLPPAWLMRLIAAFQEQQDYVGAVLPQSSDGEAHPSLAFLNTIRPLLISGLSRLGRGVQELVQSCGDLPFD